MRVLALVVVLALAAACSATPARPVAGPPTPQLRVGLRDFDIATSSVSVEAGSVTLEVTNVGATAHDLRIEGDGLDARIATLPPGGSSTMTIDTRGEQMLTLWCTLPGHRSQGMETAVDVTSGPARGS